MVIGEFNLRGNEIHQDDIQIMHDVMRVVINEVDEYFVIFV